MPAEALPSVGSPGRFCLVTVASVAGTHQGRLLICSGSKCAVCLDLAAPGKGSFQCVRRGLPAGLGAFVGWGTFVSREEGLAHFSL